MKATTPLKIIHCDICHSLKFKKVWQQPQNVLCTKCGFVFVNPRPTSKDIGKHYKTGVFTSGNVFKEYKPGSRIYLLTKERSIFLKKNLPIDAGSVLDVGCGAGEFLSTFSKSWNTFGFDPSPYAVKKASNLGLNVTIGDLENADFNNGSFDLVCLISVLEHVYSPRRSLVKIKKLLKPGGYLLLEVPEFLKTVDGVSELNTYEHLSHFSYATLSILLNSEGFEIVSQDNNCSIPNLRFIARSVKRNPGTINIKRDDYKKILHFISSEKIRENKLKLSLKVRLQKLLMDKNKPIVIFGAGNHSILLNNLVSLKNKDCVFVDSDPKKWGSLLFSKKIHSPREITKLKPSKIIISSEAFQEEIYSSLKKFQRQGIEVVKLYQKCEI